MDNEAHTYIVRRRGKPNIGVESIDGSFWNSAEVLSDFQFPWEDNAPTDMEFRALYDDDWLYCYFRVRDTNVLTYIRESKKEEVLFGDRVEIFFSVDRALRSYYCLEVDPNARIYDYHASHYRKFNAAWQWPEGHLRTFTKTSQDGYEVILSISRKSLKELGLLHGETLTAGIFRGKCMEISLTEDRMRWISWIKPVSPFPDFHIPSAFGTLVLR